MNISGSSVNPKVYDPRDKDTVKNSESSLKHQIVWLLKILSVDACENKSVRVFFPAYDVLYFL